VEPERWRRIESIYHAAFEKPPSDRVAFLKQACDGDESLCQEVLSLLAGSDETEEFLKAPALHVAAKALASAAVGEGQPPLARALPEFIGRCRVIRLLGEGGMGLVLLAEQTAPVRRQVAVKLIRAGLYDGSVLRRFQSEQQSLAVMNHPAIAKVFDAGTTPEGQPYFVMEYVDGASITKYCDVKKLKIRDRLELFVKVCEGVQHAHQKAVVHRDLKPSNVLITEIDGKPVPRIIDFGIAKAISSQTASEQTHLTQVGALIGTPGYISPEQAAGVIDEDARTDVYSLGVILYVLLTGMLPFDTAQWKTRPIDEVLRHLREDDPPSPSTRLSAERDTTASSAEQRGIAPAELTRLLRGDLDWITLKAVDKDRARRYCSPKELADDLNRYLNNEPILARPASTGYRVRKYVRRHRLGVAMSAAALLLIFGLPLASYWVFEHYFRSPRSALAFEKRNWIVIADFENLTHDPVFDRSLQTALVVGIQQSQFVNVLPPARIQEALRRMRKEGGAKLNEPVASELALREGAKAVLVCSIAEVGGAYLLTARLVEPRSRATVLAETAQAHGKSEVLPTLDSLAKSVRQKLGESLSGVTQQGLPLPRATTSSLEALTTFAEGRRLAPTNRDAAIDLIEQAVARDPDFALAHSYLGTLYYEKNDTARGEQHFVTAMKLLDRLTLREQLGIRAEVEDFRGHREQAVQYYEAYLAQYPDDYPVLFRLGWVYMASLQQYDKAIEAFEKILKINPLNGAAYINLATCYKSMEQPQKALEYYQKAFQINPAEITETYVNQEYGALLLSMGNTAKAAETFQEMLAQPPDFKKGLGYRSLGMLDIYQGKFTEGIANLKQAILLHKAARMAEGEYRDHILLASAYRTKGSARDSLAELETAKRILSSAHLGPLWIAHVAKAYARLGRTAVATKLLHDMISQAEDPTAISGINRSSAADQAYISLVKGELALQAGKSSEAIEAFQLADKLYPRSLAVESLAHAYRMLRKPQEAARVYEDALSHGKFPLLIEGQEYWILAHYELGKIYQELGDSAKAKEYYEQFLNIWKNSDSDIPMLKQAKAEYAKL